MMLFVIQTGLFLAQLNLSAFLSSTSFIFPFGPSQDGILGLHSVIMVYGLGIFGFVFVLLCIILYEFSQEGSFVKIFLRKFWTLAKRRFVGIDKLYFAYFGRSKSNPYGWRHFPPFPSSCYITDLESPADLSLESREFNFAGRFFRHGASLEVVWTVFPALILASIAFPSLQLLYAMDEVIEPALTVKVRGSQWFWNYGYTDDFPIGGNLYNQICQGLTKPVQVNFFEMYRLVTSTLKLYSADEFRAQAHYKYRTELLDDFGLDCDPNLVPSLRSRDVLKFLRPKIDFNLIEADTEKFIAWAREPYCSVFDIIKLAPNYFVFAYVKPVEEHLLKIIDGLSTWRNAYSKMLAPGARKSISDEEYVTRYKRMILMTRSLNFHTSLRYSYLSKFFESAKASYAVRSSFDSLTDPRSDELVRNTDMLPLEVDISNELNWAKIFQTRLEKNKNDPYAYGNLLLAEWPDGFPAFSELATRNDFVFVNNKNFIDFNVPLLIPLKSAVGIETRPFEYDSYMVPEQELKFGQPRLLKVDHPVVVPARTHLRFLVTSNDVLHSFAIPGAGIKIDAVPGRLNQVSAYFANEGVLFGQCSELCGVNHGFMPIELRVVSPSVYLDWLFENDGLSAKMEKYEVPERLFNVSEQGSSCILGGQRFQEDDLLLLGHLGNIKLGFENYVFYELNRQFVILVDDWVKLNLKIAYSSQSLESFRNKTDLLFSTHLAHLLWPFNEYCEFPWNNYDFEQVVKKRNKKRLK